MGSYCNKHLFGNWKQNIDEDLSNNQVDLEKMSNVLKTFPSSNHISLNTRKLESELHEMEAVAHALTHQVEVSTIFGRPKLAIAKPVFTCAGECVSAISISIRSGYVVSSNRTCEIE